MPCVEYMPVMNNLVLYFFKSYIWITCLCLIILYNIFYIIIAWDVQYCHLTASILSLSNRLRGALHIFPIFTLVSSQFHRANLVCPSCSEMEGHVFLSFIYICTFTYLYVAVKFSAAISEMVYRGLTTRHVSSETMSFLFISCTAFWVRRIQLHVLFGLKSCFITQIVWNCCISKQIASSWGKYVLYPLRG